MCVHMVWHEDNKNITKGQLMAKRKITAATRKEGFIEKLRTLAKEELDIRKQVDFAKRYLLLTNEEDIKLVVESGYPIRIIAQALTAELHSSGTPKVIKWKSVIGENMEAAIKITPIDVEKFLEETASKSM